MMDFKNIFSKKNLPMVIGVVLILGVIIWFIVKPKKEDQDGQPDPSKLDDEGLRYQDEVDAVKAGIDVETLTISKATALNIANGLENAMWGAGTDDEEIEALLETDKFGGSSYPYNAEDLKLIYSEFGLRKGLWSGYTSLGEWFADDLDDSPRLLDTVRLIFQTADIRF